jgi:N-acetylglutamate synthase-like GNAT family acetyltransferase
MIRPRASALLRWITYGPDVISVRPAVGGDAAVATSLVRAAYQRYVSRIGRLPAPVEADYEEIARSGHMWIAEDDGEVVGLIVLEDASDYLLLDNVAVSPVAQGSGVGSQLLAFAEEEAVRRGFDQVRLYTNAAMAEKVHYYLRKGYIETHRARQAGFQRVFFEKRLRR